MSCQLCNSETVRDYTAEINIHFPGMKGLDIPTIWVFPTILVCINCGTTQFAIPDADLKILVDRDYRTSTGEAA